jgi:two-component system sensor histidine kinase UhpB
VRLRLARAVQDADLREQQLDQISAEIGEAIEELRRIARGLRPPSLDMLGLGTAVDSYARSLADAAGLELDLRIGAVAGLLSPEAELALYRVMQESLSNVVRHSGAGTVRISLRRAGAFVELRIEDDGRGFRVDQALALDREGRGLGLFGMQERAGYVGGHVDIESEPGHGTRVIARMPITEAARYA